MNFHQLRVFFAVAKYGSFTRAAEALTISQPAVSAQVKAFEAACGVPLLRRGGRAFRLTDAGGVVYDYARRIFALAEEMEKAVSDIKGSLSGSLIIGASTTIGEYLLPQAMGRFKESYPGIELKMQIANSSVIAAMVLDQEVDLGFIGDKIANRSLVIEPYMKDEIVLFSSPRGRLASLAAIPPEEIGAESFIAREKGSATRRIGELELAKLGIYPRITMELSSNEAVKRAVGANLGISMLSRSALDPELNVGSLVLLDIPQFKCERQLYIARLAEKRLSKVEKAFLQMLMDESAASS